MINEYSPRLWDILCCPTCNIPLESCDDGAKCTPCNSIYRYIESGALDLRLSRPKTVQLVFEVGTSFATDDIDFSPVKNLSPEVDFSGIKRPHNVSEMFLSYFPRAHRPDSMMLDLGCGSALMGEVAACAGYEYVALDLNSSQAHLLGDAQALPFRDNSFDLVWSNAVVQYLPSPFMAIREIQRILKPQGKFIGTVGFLEAWDGASCYMFTRSGILNWLQYGGLKVSRIAPDKWWTGPVAISRMGLFPRMPDALCRALVQHLDILSKVWWRAASLRGKSVSEADRLARVTGSYQFYAIKA
ncbi:MAG: methyltransferase domain-containing protein [Anaerolineae bacterium]|nr:methyltransferase domain-containing protein [Anaerolineae bacterium]